MKAAIISVGTEILFGQITNTNTVYLSKKLNELGIDVLYHLTVGDNPSRLIEIMDFAKINCDLIITTGGLGPTQDDLTKEIVCKANNDELVLDQPSLDSIEKAFQKMNATMTKNNIKQAYLPKTSTIFPNSHGTAPGFAIEANGCTTICLPGPPKEMTKMFEKQAISYLMGKVDHAISYKLIRTIGIGESALETALLPLINNQVDPTIATYAKEGESYLRIASKRATQEEADEAVDSMLNNVKKIIGKYIYSENGDDLSKVVCEILLNKKISISTAESCTGGLFASTLVSYPGISEIFQKGYVTYSNEAKVDMINVNSEYIDKYGVVSGEVAEQMVKGLFEKTGSDLCISVTGVAGPDGGTKEKPVGTVYIGCKYRDKIISERFDLMNRGRDGIRRRSVLSMFRVIYEMLED